MKKKKSILFIVNPISGTMDKELIIEDIESMIDKDKFTYSIARTAYGGHGAVLATMAAENGTDIVVAIGGDGTVNEIARSLVHTDTALGIIPCGSGNGLARHLQIPLEYTKAIKVINDCQIHRLDYQPSPVFLYMRHGIRCNHQLQVCRIHPPGHAHLFGKYPERNHTIQA